MRHTYCSSEQSSEALQPMAHAHLGPSACAGCAAPAEIKRCLNLQTGLFKCNIKTFPGAHLRWPIRAHGGTLFVHLFNSAELRWLNGHSVEVTPESDPRDHEAYSPDLVKQATVQYSILYVK